MDIYNIGGVKMSTIIKTVKQYSYELDEEMLKELLFIANQYKNVKNYVYSRYSGINSILLLSKDRKIRDEWIKTKFYEQWKLPARYWKLALSEAFSNIKTNWSNTKNKVKDQVNRNSNLSNEDRHYINYILKFDNCYFKVLTNKELKSPKIFEDKNLNYKYLNHLIKRYTRRYKEKIPYAKTGRTFSIDTGLYSYTADGINITSTTKGKRLSIKLSDKNRYDHTMKVKIVAEKIQIHCPLRVKTKTNQNENILGIDKGYKYLFATSSEKLYGENLRHDENVKSYINCCLNNLLEQEKPKEIVMEQLDFVSWDDRFPKSVKRKLSRWIKGYIRKRLEYKCSLNNIKCTYINPAYTSKVCNICGCFGTRNGDTFTCPKCGKLHSDINASKNILNRKTDKEISLYTPYKKVKEILLNRENIS